jgi:hypothetical protein
MPATSILIKILGEIFFHELHEFRQCRQGKLPLKATDRHLLDKTGTLM